MKDISPLSLITLDSLSILIYNTTAMEFNKQLIQITTVYPDYFKIEKLDATYTQVHTSDNFTYSTEKYTTKFNIFSSVTNKFITPSITLTKNYIKIEIPSIFDYQTMCTSEIFLFLRLLNQSFEKIRINRLDLAFDFRLKEFSDIKIASEKYNLLNPASESITNYFTTKGSSTFRTYYYERSSKSLYPSINNDKVIVRLELSITNNKTMPCIRDFEKNSIQYIARFIDKKKFIATYKETEYPLPMQKTTQYLTKVFDYIQGKSDTFTVYDEKIKKISESLVKRDDVFKFIIDTNIDTYIYANKKKDFDDKGKLRKCDIINKSALLSEYQKGGHFDKTLFNRIMELYFIDEEKSKDLIRSIAETAKKKLINQTEYHYQEKTYYAPYKLSKKHKKSYPYKSVAKETTATNSILDSDC